MLDVRAEPLLNPSRSRVGQNTAWSLPKYGLGSVEAKQRIRQIPSFRLRSELKSAKMWTRVRQNWLVHQNQSQRLRQNNQCRVNNMSLLRLNQPRLSQTKINPRWKGISGIHKILVAYREVPWPHCLTRWGYVCSSSTKKGQSDLLFVWRQERKSHRDTTTNYAYRHLRYSW